MQDKKIDMKDVGLISLAIVLDFVMKQKRHLDGTNRFKFLSKKRVRLNIPIDFEIR